jgi:hypothetical protein
MKKPSNERGDKREWKGVGPNLVDYTHFSDVLFVIWRTALTLMYIYRRYNYIVTQKRTVYSKK